MTTKHQKSLEIIYAIKTGELLDESWKVEPSPNEINWPDLNDGCVIYVRRLPDHLGDRVKVRYSGSSEHGTIFGSSSLEEHPFVFTIGEKRVLPGFENAVIGMCQRETKDCLTSSRRCLRSFFHSYLQKEIIINDLTSVKEVGIIHSINKGPPLLAAWETG